MRVYLPVTTAGLRDFVARAAMTEAPIGAVACTPALVAWCADDDPEAVEYAALSEAARRSLSLMATAEQGSEPRRAVVVAELSDAAIRVLDEPDPGAVEVAAQVPMSAVAAVYADDRDAEAAVTAAVAALRAGSAGVDGALVAAEEFELSWYASQELGMLLDSL